MTTDADRVLAAELTDRFTAVEGVRGIFPEHAAAATVLAVVKGRPAGQDGLVRIDSSGPAVTISARLATLRSVPAAQVVAAANQAVLDTIGSRPYALDIEVAYID